MATETTYRPVSVERIEREDWDSAEVENGQHVKFGAYGFARRVLGPLDDEHPALWAWERLLDDVFEELHPQIRDLFYDAINKRLPWTWEPER